MSEPIFPSDEELESMLREAKELKASVSLRAMGTNRMLGDLRLAGLEPGQAMHLMGAKRRDQLPEEGTMVTLSIILGDQVVSLDSPVLSPLVAAEDAEILDSTNLSAEEVVERILELARQKNLLGRQ